MDAFLFCNISLHSIFSCFHCLSTILFKFPASRFSWKLWGHSLHFSASSVGLLTTLCTQSWISLYPQSIVPTYMDFTFRQAFFHCNGFTDHHFSFAKVNFPTLAVESYIPFSELLSRVSQLFLLAEQNHQHRVSQLTHNFLPIQRHLPQLQKQNVTTHILDASHSNPLKMCGL